MMHARPTVRQAPALSSDDDARIAARRVIAFHLAAFEREVRAGRGGDVEAIHQLRVATRRLRAALQLFAPVLPAATVGSLTEGLAWLGRGIGSVRDLDVMALAVAARCRGLGEDARLALGPLEHAIVERRAVALAALGRLLDGAECHRLLARLAQLAAARPGPRGAVRLGDVAGGLVRPLLRAVERAGKDLDAETPAVALHRLRVRAKRLRYASETLAYILGEHQDAVTQTAWLRAYAGSAQLPPATLLATGALIDRLSRRARKLRRRAVRAWSRFDRRRIRRVLLESVPGTHVPQRTTVRRRTSS
jgi:CHAD domain-containing protein